VVSDELRYYFGVRLALEDDAFHLELLLQDGVILDHAVVDNRNLFLAGPGDMRVGVAVGGPAMGGPAGVADANAPGGGVFGEKGAQVADAAGLLAEVEPVARQGRQPGTVITPILQSAQAIHQDRLRLPRADVPDDSAHVPFLVGESS